MFRRSKEGLAGQIVDAEEDTRKFSKEELRQLFRPNFETRSTAHDSLGCSCCKGIAGKRFIPVEDDNGFVHLLPGTTELRARDPSLAAVSKNVSLIFCRKVDHSDDNACAVAPTTSKEDDHCVVIDADDDGSECASEADDKSD